MQRTTAIYGNPGISGFTSSENRLYNKLYEVIHDLEDIEEIMSDHPNIDDKVINYMANLPYSYKDTKKIGESIISLAQSMSMEVHDEQPGQAGSGKHRRRRKSRMSRRRRKSHKSRKSGRHSRRRTRKH